MPTCEAHTALENSINRIHTSIDELYKLDRSKAQDISSIQISMARIEEQTKAGFDHLSQWQEEFERQTAERDERLQRAIAIRNQPPKRIPLRTIVALVSAIVGPAGLAAFISILRGSKQ
jgi:hypothetical protein